MKKINMLLLWFFILLVLSVVSFYLGFNIFSEPIGVILRFISLISIIATGVTFVFLLAEKIGKKMPEVTKRRKLISKPLQWIIGILLLCIFFGLFLAIMH